MSSDSDLADELVQKLCQAETERNLDVLNRVFLDMARYLQKQYQQSSHPFLEIIEVTGVSYGLTCMLKWTSLYRTSSLLCRDPLDVTTIPQKHVLMFAETRLRTS